MLLDQLEELTNHACGKMIDVLATVYPFIVGAWEAPNVRLLGVLLRA